MKYSIVLLIFFTSCLNNGCIRFTDNIVCLGDSVTAGYRQYPARIPAESFPRFLENMCKGDFKDAGEPGHTATDGVKRFHKDVAVKFPHTVIIMFGLNDMKVSKNEFFSSLITLVRKTRNIGARPILCTPSPHMTQNEKLKEYADIVRDVADIMYVDLVDVHRSFPLDWDYMETDNHPNTKGHEFIADLISKELD